MITQQIKKTDDSEERRAALLGADVVAACHSFPVLVPHTG